MQLPERIMIYELATDNAEDMLYKFKVWREGKRAYIRWNVSTSSDCIFGAKLLKTLLQDCCLQI